MMKAILSLVLVLVASFLVFFIIGFIVYTPPKIKPSYDSITMPMERISDTSVPVPTATGQAGEKKEGEHLSSAAERLPLLPERRGKVQVATKYKGLLTQMGSILEDMDSLQVSDAVEDRREEFASIEGNAFADEGMSAEVPMEKTIRERLVMVEDVLEYASTQTGISEDLLAAVALAGSSQGSRNRARSEKKRGAGHPPGAPVGKAPSARKRACTQEF